MHASARQHNTSSATFKGATLRSSNPNPNPRTIPPSPVALSFGTYRTRAFELPPDLSRAVRYVPQHIILWLPTRIPRRAVAGRGPAPDHVTLIRVVPKVLGVVGWAVVYPTARTVGGRGGGTTGATGTGTATSPPTTTATGTTTTTTTAPTVGARHTA